MDPGIKGALALRGDGAVLSVWDVPTYTKEAGARGAQRAFIDEGALFELIAGAAVLGAELFVIEDVGGMPGQSAAAAFVFGRGYGAALMAARANQMRLEAVKAARWKLQLRVPADKSAARVRASELMPRDAWRWPLKGHDGRAEAAMLGLYAEQFFRG